MKYVLFVCTHNACRSQMAQALFDIPDPAACECLRLESCDMLGPADR